MRVKLKLQAAHQRSQLPLNCNHAIAGLIYQILSHASEEFAARMHNEGYFSDDGRHFKLFTYSRLIFRRNHLADNRIVLDDPAVELLISSPVGDFIENFVTGLFHSKEFYIAGTAFSLTEAETLPLPCFTTAKYFRALSPITESLRDEQDRTRFLSLNEDWSDVMQRNLLRKYRALHGYDPADTNLHWKWDQAYLKRLSEQGRRASVLSDINGIKVRGWLAPFTVEGSTELIELGYEAGFGSRNSVGFGMAEVSS